MLRSARVNRLTHRSKHLSEWDYSDVQGLTTGSESPQVEFKRSDDSIYAAARTVCDMQRLRGLCANRGCGSIWTKNDPSARLLN
jgi:hypothetical protein